MKRQRLSQRELLSPATPNGIYRLVHAIGREAIGKLASAVECFDRIVGSENVLALPRKLAVVMEKLILKKTHAEFADDLDPEPVDSSIILACNNSMSLTDSKIVAKPKPVYSCVLRHCARLGMISTRSAPIGLIGTARHDLDDEIGEVWRGERRRVAASSIRFSAAVCLPNSGSLDAKFHKE